MNKDFFRTRGNPKTLCAVLLVLLMPVFFFTCVSVTSYGGGVSLASWIKSTWTVETEYEHGWAVPALFLVFVWLKRKEMSHEAVAKSSWCLLLVCIGLLCYVATVRTLQMRLAFFGLPFLIVGGTGYVWGWKVARHMVFPAFFWYFAIPMPGLQHATNALQIAVTKSCYHVGTAMGMELVNSGTVIKSATGGWNELDIEEGCSGIRSLMALVMVAAIYAYFTQKKVWKMALLFACSLPLALVANFFRIFTIVVLAEMGYSKFAAGAYHDWAGLLFFFPIALAGLFLVDKLINWKANRKVVRRRLNA